MVKRQTKGSVLDISIRGDELEHNRIQLENNLQHTDLSFRLSSVSDNDEFNDVASAEYPRHNSGPTPFPDFPSFEHRSRDHFDGDTHSQIHPWSYRTVDDDEEGINPYAGETMSTAAHHASALTLSAGLGGGRGTRRDISLSGAEYDPDRPLHDMIAGVNSRLSVFDVEASRSKYPGIGSVTFDPLVVDNTAELDRVLQSGYAPPLGSHPQDLRSPLVSSSSSSASDSDNHPTSRPKLSDALRRVSFSPKRPRSAQSNRSDSRHQPAPSPLVYTGPLPDASASRNMPTPKPIKKANIFPSYPSSPMQPQVRLQPPTPSTNGSKFSRMARGITREIEEQQHVHAESSRPTSAPAGDRNPFETTIRQPTPRKASYTRQPTPRGKVHLPDVTGLTSAVESPAKPGSEYYSYRAGDGPREGEARLLKTLNTVQSKLRHLEEENGISRRRINELEMELEVCKRDVARERSRVMEREEVIVQQQRDISSIASRRDKGKSKAKNLSINEDLLNDRYREAVEEKKALEALIATLRTHLTRLTSELSSHQELLSELRALRDTDSRALKQKSREIDRLKEEVERLGGEIEVLRGVVEEGLKERRSVREVSVVHSTADLAMSEDLDTEDEDEENDEIETEAPANQSRSRVYREQRSEERDAEQNEDENEDQEEEEEDEPIPFDPVSILGSSRGNYADRTMRTDHATLGSSGLGTSTQGGDFINSQEFEQISAEVEERRLERSGLSPSHVQFQPEPVSQMRSRSSSPTPQRPRNVTVQEVPDQDNYRDRPPASPAHTSIVANHTRQQLSPRTSHSQPSSSRPPAPTPAQASKRNPHHSKPNLSSIKETPFPQIRGAHLERLFFSAPEHNAKTCTVCHRRRREPDASWIPPRFKGRADESSDEEHEEEDEGFAEGSEEPEHDHNVNHKGKQREHVTFSQEPGPWRRQAKKEGLPPQTVVTRVIRELEDDFTHYKSIYVELADQYKDMDAASDVYKRNVLAQHLREVVDILEQKGDQIASLYDLLTFKDKPISESAVPSRSRPPPATTASYGLKRHPTTLI